MDEKEKVHHTDSLMGQRINTVDLDLEQICYQ